MSQRGSWWRRTAFVLALAVAAGAGWWGAHVTLVPAKASEAAAPSTVTATVQQASVGRAVSFNATVTQPFALVATNGLAGIVTAVGPGGTVSPGDLLYSVAGRGVYAVDGSTPFYRDLELKATGPDVTELQQALAAWGYSARTSGVFDAATTTAVKAWQTATKQPATGVVTLGTVLAVPQLPAAVKLGPALVRGAHVSGGEPGVLARAGQPSFALLLSSDQASLVPAGARVDVHSGSSTWPAVVSHSSVDQNGNTSLGLTAPDGSLVCGTTCASLPADEHATLLAEVHLVPESSGPAVPVAAVRTGADGSTYVLTPAGTRTDVTVKASGDGLAVVDGLTVGSQVIVLDASTPPAAQPAPTPRPSDATAG